VPGDRGDKVQVAGIEAAMNTKSPVMPDKLGGEASPPREKIGTGWGGNVRR
jgi:hypothetical protein